MKKSFLIIFTILFLDLLLTAQLCFGQSQQLTAEIKKQTIDDLSALLRERYAYKEIGQKLQQLLQQNLKVGKYDSYNSPQDFSVAVTNDLRSLNPDRHLALNYSPEAQTPNANPNSTPSSGNTRRKSKTGFKVQPPNEFRFESRSVF